MATTKLRLSAFAGSGLTALSMMGVRDWYGSAFENCPDLMRLYFPVTDSEKYVNYSNVPFTVDNAQVIVNNPNIENLDDQEAKYGADLYLSMVKGGVTVGNGWKRVYVPGRSADLYRNLTSSEVVEMYSYETYPEEGAVVIKALAAGVKIKSVIIEGREATNDGNRYYVEGLTVSDDRMNVIVNYTVANNPMTSYYEWIYTGIDNLNPDADTDEVWYNISGLRIDKDRAAPGIYIVVKNGRTSKVTVD